MVNLRSLSIQSPNMELHTLEILSEWRSSKMFTFAQGWKKNAD